MLFIVRIYKIRVELPLPTSRIAGSPRQQGLTLREKYSLCLYLSQKTAGTKKDLPAYPFIMRLSVARMMRRSVRSPASAMYFLLRASLAGITCLI